MKLLRLSNLFGYRVGLSGLSEKIQTTSINRAMQEEEKERLNLQLRVDEALGNFKSIQHTKAFRGEQ